MKLILYAAIILSTLCSISEAGTVVSAHWEATITNMDSQISEVRVRRDAADLETSAESDDVEDQCDAELIRLRTRKREIAKAFTAWQSPTESIDTKMAEVRARRKVAELDDTSTENDAVLEQCHVELRSLKKEKLQSKTIEIPEEVKEVVIAAQQEKAEKGKATTKSTNLSEKEKIAKKMNLSLDEIVSIQ